MRLLIWLVLFYALTSFAWDNDNINEGIIIVKIQTFGGDGQFTFASVKLGSFSIMTSALSGNKEFDGLAAGTYDLSETVPAGWTLQSATCDNHSPVSAVYLENDDQTVTCTFVNVKQQPSITISQSVQNSNGPGPVALGDLLTFSFLVTNNGNVALSDVTVSDTFAGLSTPSCPSAVLAANTSMTCTASYTVQQPDVDNGAIKNTASVSATPPSGPNVTATTTELDLGIAQAPALAIFISWVPTVFNLAGEKINFTYTLTNTGNVTLSGLLVNDPAAICVSSMIAPGASTTCSSSYAVSQADVDNGSFVKMVSASGSDKSKSTTASASATVYATQITSLLIVISWTPNAFSAPNQVINFTYTLTNAGNTTLKNLALSDSSSICLSRIIAPGTSTLCSSSYTTTQSDIDAGSITKAVQASAFDNLGAESIVSDSVTVPAIQNPALSIAKSASPTSYSAAGQVIDYTYLLTNSGNVTLGGPFSVSDGGLVVTCPATAILAPGNSITCTSSYTVTQNDIDNGKISNTASGSNGSGSVKSPPTTVIIGASQNSMLGGIEISYNIGFSSLGKNNSSSLVLGDTVNFTFLLKNSGNTTVNGIVLTSDLSGLDLKCTPPLPANLAPGGTLSCTASHVVSAQDIAKGKLVASVTATATSPDGTTVTSTGSVSLTVANVCGDGVMSPSEACDDGENNSATGACSQTCTVNTCVTVAVALAASCDQSTQGNAQSWIAMALLAIPFWLRKRRHANR